MSRATVSAETKFVIVIIAIFLGIPLIFYLLDRFYLSARRTDADKKTAITVIVTEADKKSATAKTPTGSVVKDVRDAIKPGESSEAHVQLKKVPKDSPEYKELLKKMAEAEVNRKGSGLRKVEETAKTPLRYLDESTPRDRLSDAIYLYIVDYSGTPSPWFCIQSYGSRPRKISSFTIKADGKIMAIKQPIVVTEKIQDKFAEYYDAPLNRESYAAVELLANARNAELVYGGSPRAKGRKITEEEKRGMKRILELYEALGGTFAAFTRQ